LGGGRWADVARLLHGEGRAAACAATLAGKVVADHSGNPLTSVKVRFRTGSRHLAADLETVAYGRFEAPGLPAGEYRIEASIANHVTSTLRQVVATDEFGVSVDECRGQGKSDQENQDDRSRAMIGDQFLPRAWAVLTNRPTPVVC
jgi:hypothetical protein